MASQAGHLVGLRRFRAGASTSAVPRRGASCAGPGPGAEAGAHATPGRLVDDASIGKAMRVAEELPDAGDAATRRKPGQPAAS